MLSIEHLSVDYVRGGRVIPAVRDVSLAIDRGETVGLAGESGSGKSTVALAILRLIREQEGRITGGRILLQPNSSPLVGEDEGGGGMPVTPHPAPSPTRGEGINLLSISEERMREVRGKRISMIFQDPFTSLNPVMRIRDQMEEILVAHPVGAGFHPRPQLESNSESLGSDFGQARRPAPTILADALLRVQLDPTRILASYPHQLSGGQRQRVMIAMSLLTGPQIILADEPTTALDVLVQKEVLDLLLRLQKELGFGLLLISHNLGLLAQSAGRILVMKEGRIVESGAPLALFSHAQNAYTRQLIDAFRKLV